jgi:hypothetical protein
MSSAGSSAGSSTGSSAGIASTAVAVLVLLASCGADKSCTRTAPPADCHDIEFENVSYDEWREVKPPRITQEVGDATYPACNDTDSCDGEGLGGFGTTDVFLVDGVDPAKAVLGLREGTHTTVLFVATGVAPESLEHRINAKLFDL